MLIGIDVDDTLVNSSESFDNLIKNNNINFSKKFNDKWTKEEKRIIFENYLKDTLTNAKLKKDAKDVLNYLESIGYKLIIITARNNKNCEGIEEFTIDFFKKEGIKISEYYFGEFKKSDIAKDLNIDLMIDDNEMVYKNMKDENIECILFGNRIKSWKEVLEYIESKVKYNG